MPRVGFRVGRRIGSSSSQAMAAKKRPAAAKPPPGKKQPQQGKKIKVDMNGQQTMNEFQREVSVEVKRALETETESAPCPIANEAYDREIGDEEAMDMRRDMDDLGEDDEAAEKVTADEDIGVDLEVPAGEDNIDCDLEAEGKKGFFPEADRQGHVNVETFLVDVATKMVASLLKAFADLAPHFHAWADRFYAIPQGSVCTGSGMAEIAAKAGMDALRLQFERPDVSAVIEFGRLDLTLFGTFLSFLPLPLTRCEVKKQKRAFLMQTCFFNMADDPCLFSDVTTLFSNEHRACVLDQHCGCCQVPKVDMVIAGTSCTGGSKLNMKSAELRTAMAEGRKDVQTVATFLGFVEALELSEAMCAILENVTSMGDFEAANMGVLVNDNLSEFVRVLSEAGWVSHITTLQSNDYYLPQRRQRIYMFAFKETWLNETGVDAGDVLLTLWRCWSAWPPLAKLTQCLLSWRSLRVATSEKSWSACKRFTPKQSYRGLPSGRMSIWSSAESGTSAGHRKRPQISWNRLGIRQGASFKSKWRVC